MKKNAKLTWFIVLCLFAVLYFVPSVSADVPKPNWVSGDKWVYASSEYGITTNTTLEYEGIETINVNGTSYDVYSMKKEDTISMYGIDLTYPGHAYYQRSDMGMVKMDQTLSMFGLTSSDVTTYAPPKKDCKFPLSVGQTWTETFTEITYSSMDDEIITYDEATYTNTYNVLLQEEITVEAGTFDTYKIECEDEDGDSIYSWYAPVVKNFVKVSAGGSTNQLTFYDVTEPQTSGNGDPNAIGEEGEFDLFAMPYLLFLILIPIIVVVLAVGLVARGRKKKRTQAQVSSQPTVDFTVQGAYVAQPPSGYTQTQQTAQPRQPQRAPAQRAAPKQTRTPPRTQAARPTPKAAPAKRPAPKQTRAPPRTQAARPPPRTAPARPPPKKQAAPKQTQTQPVRPPAHPRPMPKTQPVAAAAPPRQAPPQQQPPPPPPPPTPVYPCPTCKQPLDLIKQYNRWYCRNCKKYP